MDYLSSLSNSDNLFKFLFLGGIMMILISMIYPLQKKQEIDIEVLAYNKEVCLLNLEIDELQNTVNKASKEAKKTLRKLDSLKNIKDSKTQICKIQKKTNTEFAIIAKQKRNQDIKLIVLQFNKNKIEVLKQHSDTYNSYSNKLLFWGIIIANLGFLGWVYSTIQTEILKRKEIKKQNT